MSQDQAIDGGINEPGTGETTPTAPPGPGPRRGSLALEGLGILLLALTLNLAGNGRISLWDRDEPRYAGCAREMRASGDYLHPTFNAEPRYHKPVLIYWLMQAGTAVGGENEFGARLVSSLSGAMTCLVVWGLGRSMFGATAGRLAALVLATSPIVCAESKMATTDAFLMLALTVCQAALWKLGRATSRSSSSRGWAALFWGSLALATLTKGPVGLVLIGSSTALAFWWGGMGLSVLRRMEWTWGLIGFTLIVAPWFIAIGIISDGAFYRVAMGYHVIRRMTSPLETHGGFPGYYAVLSMGLMYPWSALVPAGAAAAWRRHRGRPELGFVLGWVIGPLVVLELVRTKLIHYYLPSYPAWALLVAWFVGAVAASEVNLRRWPLGRLAMGTLTGLGVAITVGLLGLAVVVNDPNVRWPAAVMALLVAAGTMAAVVDLQSGRTRKASWVLVGTWAAVLMMLTTFLAPGAEPYRLSPQLARALIQVAGETNAEPMLGGYKAPSVIYYAGRPLSYLEGRDELAGAVQTGRPVATALTAPEMKHLRADPRLLIEPHGTVTGFDVEHARTTTLELVVVRPAVPVAAVAARPGDRPAAHR